MKTNKMTISKIGIIGSGKMGSDIFNYFLDNDFVLSMICENILTAEAFSKSFEKKLNRKLKNGLIDEKAYLQKKNTTIIAYDFKQLKDCNIVIEAVNEDASLKNKIFKQAEKYIDNTTILATNSSSILPSLIFDGVSKPERCLGLHFFYPIMFKNLCEVVSSPFTSLEVIKSTEQFLEKVNKFHLIQNEENPFIINRIFLGIQAEAFNILSEGIYTIEQIDLTVKRRIFPIGIFDFIDNVGIDVMLASVNEYVKYEIDKSKYDNLINILKQKIAQNQVGKKNGKGFYDYTIQTNIVSIFIENESLLSYRLLKAFISHSLQFLNSKDITEQMLDYIVKEYSDADYGPAELSKKLIDNI